MSDLFPAGTEAIPKGHFPLVKRFFLRPLRFPVDESDILPIIACVSVTDFCALTAAIFI